MKFEKFPLSLKKAENYYRQKFFSQRSLLIGKRIIKKQQNKLGLFWEEYAEYKTPQERAEYNLKEMLKTIKKHRKFNASMWIEARKNFYKLEKDEKEIVYFLYNYYNKFTPERLSDLTKKIKYDFFDCYISYLIFSLDDIQKIQKIAKLELKIKNFLKFIQKEILNKFNLNYLNVSFNNKEQITIKFFPYKDYQKKMKKEQEEKVINSFNKYFANLNKTNKEYLKILKEFKFKEIKYY